MQDNIYKIYQQGNQRLYPENIFEIENIDRLKEMANKNCEYQLFYKGIFDSKVLSVLGKYILQVVDNGSMASEKLFKIFMELAQNISFYSGERSTGDKNDGLGIIFINYKNNQYFLHTGNIIINSDVQEITEKLKLINTLDHQGLREFKRKQRHLERGEKGTANVGLIQVAITSENRLIYNFEKVNDEFSFFSLLVTVNSLL